MRKILVLENDNTFTKERQGTLFKWIQNKKSEPGTEVQIIINANNTSSEILEEAFVWCDTLACHPTFTDMSQVEYLAEMLSKLPSKNVIIDSYDVEERLGSLDDELLFKTKHHKMFQLFKNFDDEAPSYLDLKPFNFKERTDEVQKKADELAKYVATRENAITGRKIRLLDIQAVGSTFANLKKGEVVYEIDNSKMDPNPNRGIWVWGVGEPVKLLNEGEYNEYEFIEPLSIGELSCEIMKKLYIEQDDKKLRHIELIIMTDDSHMSKANEICEILEIEKRGNRAFIRELLNKHCDEKRETNESTV